MIQKAKKGPRTLAGFHGGNGGEPNKGILPQAPTDCKHEPLMTGRDKNGRRVDVYPGDIARVIVQHDSWCPMLKNTGPCRCNPDSYIEIISRAGGAR